MWWPLMPSRKGAVGFRWIAPLAASLILVSACAAASPSRTPTSAPASTTTASPAAEPSAAGSPISSKSPTAAGPRWEAAGTMGVASPAFATQLDDGRVLIVGNVAADGRSVVNIWDPSTRQSSSTAPTGKPRSQFGAARLSDGRVLVAGGLNAGADYQPAGPQSYSSAVVFDPASEQWSATGLMNVARTGPIAATLTDGRVLAAGGFFYVQPTYPQGLVPGAVLAAYLPGDSSDPAGPPLADMAPDPIGAALATAELFDPASGRWTATGPMKYARYGAAATRLADGRILVVGSVEDTGVAVPAGAVASAELYDPSTGKWSLAGALPPLDTAALAKLGFDFSDGYLGVLSSVGSLVALDDGGALLVGTKWWAKHTGEITRSFRLDPRSRTWRQVGDIAMAWRRGDGEQYDSTKAVDRAGAFVARLPDGRILVAGGGMSVEGGATPTASAVAYDPGKDTWVPLPSMPAPRVGGLAVPLADGSVLLIGGSGDDQHADVPATLIRFVP